MKKYFVFSVAVLLCLFFVLTQNCLKAEESLFSPSIASSALVQKLFSFIEENKENIIKEWIYLTEIPAPSGYEEKRAKYLKEQFITVGLEDVHIDESGNVIGIWKGKKRGTKIIFSAHMDTVFQEVWEIKAERIGNILKAPGVGDDTASLINLLWSIRALKKVGFVPDNTYYFLATVGEEIGFNGMYDFLNKTKENFDLVIALDGDLGKIHYGALGFGGGDIVFFGPGAHTMQSRDIPNPNLAVARAIERIYEIELPIAPIERWTILNIGMIKGGRVRNAVSQESSLTIDLRSANQEELERAQKKIWEICENVADEEGVKVKIELNENSKAFQIPGAKNSFLVKTAVDILEFLKVKDIEVDPLGSTEANVGIEKGIPSINLGRTYGRFKHSLREEADIEGLFIAQKSILLLISSLH